MTNPSLRSFLFAPGDSARKIDKAVAGDADAVIFDLEDAVADSEKIAARKLVRDRLAHGARRDRLWVRINPLSGDQALADLSAVMPAAPAGIMLPKITGPGDIAKLDHFLTALEAQAGSPIGQTRIIAVVTETPQALFQLGQLGGITPRLCGLSWGAEDLAAALQASSNRDEAGQLTHPYQLARSLCLIAAHAAGVQAIETITMDYKNSDQIAAYAGRARRDGFGGMLAIHPDQIAPIHAAFAPTADEIALARQIIAAFSADLGIGTVGIGGKMYDRPHMVQSLHVLRAAGITVP